MTNDLDLTKNDYYIYSLSIQAPANSTSENYLKISADADFVVKRIIITADDYTSTIRIYDTSSSKEWFSKDIPLNHLAGNYGVNSRPNSLFTPKRIPANNTLTITITNSGSSANNINISFEGYRVLR